MANNTNLVKLGGIGQAKGRTTTQTFAVRMQRDFARANSDLAPLAGTLGVDAPATMTPAAQAEVAKLAPLGDDDFDTAYGKALVTLLQADIAQFQAMADAKAGPASDLAAAQLPVLQKTLDGAKRIAR